MGTKGQWSVRALLVIGSLSLLSAAVFAGAYPERYGFGIEVNSKLIQDFVVHPIVLPDGRNLPPGRGSVADGARIYAAKCAMCHGPTGKEGPFDILVNSEPISAQLSRGSRPIKAIGNYWPYATSLWDYIRRAMPFNQPGSLTYDEVYAVVAWLLYMNGILPENAILDQTTLPQVHMPGRDLFVPDPRPFFGP